MMNMASHGFLLFLAVFHSRDHNLEQDSWLTCSRYVHLLLEMTRDLCWRWFDFIYWSCPHLEWINVLHSLVDRWKCYLAYLVVFIVISCYCPHLEWINVLHLLVDHWKCFLTYLVVFVAVSCYCCSESRPISYTVASEFVLFWLFAQWEVLPPFLSMVLRNLIYLYYDVEIHVGSWLVVSHIHLIWYYTSDLHHPCGWNWITHLYDLVFYSGSHHHGSWSERISWFYTLVVCAYYNWKRRGRLSWICVTRRSWAHYRTH